MFTDLAVQALKIKGQQYTAWDIPNFGVRVSQNGVKTFVVMLGRRRRRVTVGRYPDMSLKEARRKAQALLHSAKDEPKSETLINCLHAYAKLHLPTYTGTNRRDSEHLLFKFLEKYERTPIRQITARQILTILDPLKPSMHNHMFALFRTFFNWCVRRDYLDLNPLHKMRKPFKRVSRERVLTDDELRRIWTASTTCGTYGAIVRFLALTGQRRGEIAGLQRSYLHTDRITWPGKVVKNKREHTLPVSPSIIAMAERLADDLAEVPADNWHRHKTELDRSSGVKGWTLHDLRRTFATNSAMLGVAPHVIEAILNHKTGEISGVAAIYNRHRYVDEMRAAMTKYEQHLAQLLSANPTADCSGVYSHRETSDSSSAPNRL